MAGSTEDFAADAEQEHGLIKKSRIHIEFLEKLFSEEKYPNQKDIEDCAAVLDLTFNQVRSWFTKRRKREKREKDKLASGRLCSRVGVNNKSAINGGENAEGMSIQSRLKTYRSQKPMARGKQVKVSSVSVQRIQILFPKDYILKRIFRKDGPPLGVKFDCLPEKAFGYPTGCYDHPHPCRSSKRILERRKACESALCNGRSPSKRHGIGKGLMTVWRVANPENWDVDRECIDVDDISEEGYHVFEKLSNARIIKRKNMAGSMQRRKVLSSRKRKQAVECSLGMSGSTFEEQLNTPETLMDDEELELIELQMQSNPPRCSAHIASSGRSGCPLCKDMLPRFPPPSVRMKQPICGNPWDSSPEIVKKFFKVLCFLYTHAATTDVPPFTLDELAQAFHDKDSMLLGSIHVALLRLLLFNVKRELTDGFFPRGSKDCRFLGFLHSVRQQELDVDFWSQSLNPLTWVEILRQVMISAGFASRKFSTKKNRGEEGGAMAKYGLRHRTLKGELFVILSKQGSSGAKVNDLARSSQIVGLDLCATPSELEAQICCTLSSDCTLFEKIGPSAYRLRKGPATAKSTDESEPDTEYSGSVDYDDDSGDSSFSRDSEDGPSCSESSGRATRLQKKGRKRSLQAVRSMEIDESFPGAGWLLGLMEGEYSDLSIEEKLDALVALIDLTGSCSSLRIEHRVAGCGSATVPEARRRGSGGKIKKAAVAVGPSGLNQDPVFMRSCPGGDSSVVWSKSNAFSSHLLQAIPLGRDRRYNGYWLFLGPCGLGDPGHRRVYFESSEDGHWEVINSTKALAALLSALDSRGARESRLLAALSQREAFLTQAMEESSVAEAEAANNYRKAHCNPLDTDASSGHSLSSPISDVDNNLPCEDAYSLPPGVVVPEIGRRAEERQQRWVRAQAFDKWLWDHFYSDLAAVRRDGCRWQFLEPLTRCEACHDLFWRDEKHCKTCHVTFELDFDLEERFLIHAATCRPAADNGVHPAATIPGHRVLPSQLQALKAAVHVVEACMPEEALADAWRRSAHKLWVKRLRRVSSMPELFQVVADFVGAIREGWVQQGGVGLDDDLTMVFQTMPQTTSAFALWLVKLDGLVAPHLRRLHPLPLCSSAPVKRKRGSW